MDLGLGATHHPWAPPPGRNTVATRWRHDLVVLGALAAMGLAWDALRLDLPVSRAFGDAGGFALRHHAWLEAVLHDGAQNLARLGVLALAVAVWCRAPGLRGLTRRQRWTWTVATVACAAVVPLLKVASRTSCPWSLAEFGGTVAYVSHWALGVGDGGPGRCFPAGHPTAAFCFLPTALVLRDVAPRSARLVWWATWAAGLVLTGVQVARGAHFPSHGLWSAWLCLAVAVAVVQLMSRRRRAADTAADDRCPPPVRRLP